jgi:nucleoside-diphosphate-sugar epimerase|tara:strand:+ start:1086 stop:2000 length:915 start_codon:yes stop_codon:yes gene_type:complete
MIVDKNMKTILIGPTGFLGPSFLKLDPSITAVGRSSLPCGLTNKLVKIGSNFDFSPLDDLEFDNVIFLIGSSDHKILNAHPTMAIEQNVLALSCFLDYLKKSDRKVNKIINFTTMLQYDSLKMNIPCDESQPRKPFVNNYVMSKFISELITEQYRDTFPIIDVRISNVYGPTSLYRPDIVPSIIWQLLETGEGSVWNMSPKRDFIFVEDAVSAVFKLINCSYSGAVNLGSGVSSSVQELCACLENISGISISDQGVPVSGHMEFCQDISLIKMLTDWEPQFSLARGLEKTYKEMQFIHQQRAQD